MSSLTPVVYTKQALRELGLDWSDDRISYYEARGRFPRRLKLAPGKNARVGWLVSEINEWFQQRIAERDNPE
jgi:predicted DNA-binding transcriptional regulator AlpA